MSKWTFRCDNEDESTEMVVWKDGLTWPDLLDRFTDFMRGSGYSYLREIEFEQIPDSWEQKFDELNDKYNTLLEKTATKSSSTSKRR